MSSSKFEKEQCQKKVKKWGDLNARNHLMSPNIVQTKVNHFSLHRKIWKLKYNDAEGKQIWVFISLIPLPSPSSQPSAIGCLAWILGFSQSQHNTYNNQKFLKSWARQGWGQVRNSLRKKRKAQQGSYLSGLYHAPWCHTEGFLIRNITEGELWST